MRGRNEIKNGRVRMIGKNEELTVKRKNIKS